MLVTVVDKALRGGTVALPNYTIGPKLVQRRYLTLSMEVITMTSTYTPFSVIFQPMSQDLLFSCILLSLRGGVCV